MKLFSEITIPVSAYKIDYSTPMIFVGSCFSSHIGDRFRQLKMPAMVNPFGTVYNPISIGKTLHNILLCKEYGTADIYKVSDRYVSLDHYTLFSDELPDRLLALINSGVVEAHKMLQRSNYLFVTFGTAMIYRLKESGYVVSNCHKLPESQFERERLSVEAIVEFWQELLCELHNLLPHLRVIFTVSPIRHWKDGAHNNQISKSTLLLAIDTLMEQFDFIDYFPAYEIVIDELRDYRFYAPDLFHLSTQAVDYIWERFSQTFFTSEVVALQREYEKLSKAINHRVVGGSPSEIEKFKHSTLALIDKLEKKEPTISLSVEKKIVEAL